MRILIVDDDPATLLCLGKALAPLGQVTTAVSGQEALEAFGNALAEGRPFPLVSLDIIMPGLTARPRSRPCATWRPGTAWPPARRPRS